MMAHAFLGTCWGLLAALLGGRAIGSSILWGVFVSPLIGVAVGRFIHPSFVRATGAYRALIAFGSLYASAVIFGLAVGLGDLGRGGAAEGPEVIWQGVASVLYGTSLFVIALWPLAYLSHVLIAMEGPWWRRPR